MTMQRVARLCLGMPAALAICAVFAHAGDLEVGQRAPRLETELVDGRMLPARRLEGRVQLHYFWATWCPICKSDMPRLQRLYETYRPLGLEIVAQSLDDDASVVIEHWRARGYTFPVAMRSEETRSGFGAIRGTPTLFLIDRSGTVRLKRLGRLPEGALETQVAALIKEPAAIPPK